MNYAKMIDHTLLKQQATRPQFVQLCQEAKEHGFKSVCVNPSWVATCRSLLEGSDVLVCTVVGFPLGATSTASKVFETKQAIKDGASEVDMVMHIGKCIEGDFDYIVEDIRAVKEACGDKVLKVIIETCLLTDEQKKLACEAVVAANADFAKTSTGFSTNGATIPDVKLMKEVVDGACLIKAAGGVKCYDDLVAMVEAGADRIGTSSGVALLAKKAPTESY